VKNCHDYEGVSCGVSDTANGGGISQAYSMLALGQAIALYMDLDREGVQSEEGGPQWLRSRSNENGI
jgi:hypothetical protein